VDRKRLQANIVQDTERIDSLSQYIVIYFLPSVFTSIMLGSVLIALNWSLFLISLSVAPLVVFVNRLMVRKVRERTRQYQRTFALFSKGVQFVLQVLDLTRTLSAESFEIAKQRKIIESVHRAGRSMYWLNTAYTETNTAITASVTVVIMIIGGLAIISRSMTLGDLLSFYVVLNILRGHASTIASSIPLMVSGNESIGTLFGILSKEEKQPYHGTGKIEFAGRIALTGVHFRYNNQPLLDDINLEIQPHETVAIVGRNGSGKSTIISLILGFYYPQQGYLSADTRPYEEIDLAGLRRQFGVVPQDPILFPGTILENIVYGYPEVPENEVVAAAELSMAHEFVKDLPLGYATPIGEHGTLLSGGQRQRIAIARALLRHPKFLILDEPTNHLDSTAVSKLMNNLKGNGDSPSILLVTHDSEVVQEADRVYKLEAGGLLEIESLRDVHDIFPADVTRGQ
jgi:ATP-binding cassette, subfamily B, bacterial